MPRCRYRTGIPHAAAIAMTLLLLLTAAESFAQGRKGAVAGRSEDDFTFVPVPFINYNRSIELSLGLLPMAMFNPVPSDSLSPSSIAGVLAMYSTNKTWFLMGFGRVYLDEDNWRLTAAGGKGSVNFQFYFANQFIPYNAGADFAFFEVQKRLFSKLYLGLNYRFMRFETSTDRIERTAVAEHHGLGTLLSMDKRSSVYYPYSGYNSNIKYTAFPDFLGNEHKSHKIEIEHNHYFLFRKKTDVLAVRLYGGFGIGDLSFNQQFIVGGRDIRGYSEGAYRGDRLLAAQAEYRWNIHDRWGIVGFAGLATVYDALNRKHDGELLPGIGTGLRFNAFPENHMNVGIDLALGKEDWGVYFRVGEVF